MASPFGVALAGGLAGAAALTLVHEAGRKLTIDAPRMDVLGRRALTRGFHAAGRTPPPDSRLFLWALAGDLVANSLYYAAVPAATPAATWQRGVLLGALAGVGAVALPERLGLGTPPHSESRRNQLLTVAWYLVGGLVAAAVANALHRDSA